MLLFLVAYLGGVLTILSPCILPVLPFVFARADQPFVRSGLPLLAGMALTFAGVASLAAVGGGWAVQANQYGRYAAMALMAFFGLTLLLPRLADRLTHPLVQLGERLSASAGGGAPSVATSLLLGVATGLLWAPCAGPILGLVLTGAALSGASAQTTLLLLAYAAGTATSLGAALLVGDRVFRAMKRSLGAGEWIRRAIGVALLAGVAAIALGLDTGVLAQLSLAGTSRVEQALVEKVRPAPANPPAAPATTAAGTPGTLPVEDLHPDFAGAVQWLNSPPLTLEALKGKVVLVDFWTYSCINCLRALPYVRAWAEKYKDQGLVVIGVHAPEFAFEKNVDNVRKATVDLKIGYPVAIDNHYDIWQSFKNLYWPAHYFLDAQGRVRYHHFGEGEYDDSEHVIQQLLAEAGQHGVPQDVVQVDAQGAQAAAASVMVVQSQETYVGYDRADNFASPGGQVRDQPHTYATGPLAQLNQWGLAGEWTVGKQQAVLGKAGGGIGYRFHARDLHLVLGSATDGKPIRFRVLLDGKPPGADHGVDVDAEGYGTIDGQRLYQLVRQSSGASIIDRRFNIQFLAPGVQAFAFTFG